MSGWPLFVDRVYVVGAWNIVYLLRVAQMENQTWQMVMKKPPRVVSALNIVNDVSGSVRMHYSRVWEPVRRSAEQLAADAARKYLFVDFAMDVKGFGPITVLPFIASPPDITLKRAGPIVKPSSYINVHFIPVVLRKGSSERHYRSVLAKFFYSKVTASLRFKQYIKENLQLRRVYESSLKKYKERGYPEARAKKLAFRDALRVVIGCVWLVRMHELLDNGLVSPDEVILPYREMVEKIKLGELVDPWFIATSERIKAKVYEYTWRNLLKKLGVNA